MGHYSEDLQPAFRSAYSLFDKIGQFLNDYFQIGLAAGEVNFRKVWSKRSSSSGSQIRPTFAGRRNWPLRGLYILSKDLFDRDFEEVAEPDAARASETTQSD